MGINVVAEKVQVCDTEQALVGVDNDSVRGESSEYSFQVLEVLFLGKTCNENVVNVGICSRDTTEDLIHKTLECLSSISKSEWHLDELEKSEWGGYGSLGNVRGGPLGSGGRPGPGPWRKWRHPVVRQRNHVYEAQGTCLLKAR